jgi:DNA-binding LytR/AlgR family response regulator
VLMKVIIIEDELLAQAKLEAMLLALDPSIQILARLSSVKDTLAWLSHHPPPDVAFVDIQLADDHAFEIFRKYPVQFPVVFTTAFDKYLLESFEFNSIDYLLKPITEEKLKRSLTKLKKLEQHFVQGNILRLTGQAGTPAPTRIVAKKGTEFITLTADEIAFFYTEHRVVFVKDHAGHQFIVDKNLGELEAGLDNKKFFRINRKFIAHINAIEKFKPDNGKIRVFLKPAMQEEIYVSKETAPDFRKWIGAE